MFFYEGIWRWSAARSDELAHIQSIVVNITISGVDGVACGPYASGKYSLDAT